MLAGWNAIFKRREPELARQPLALEHLREMGRAVSRVLLTDDAYGALLTIAATRSVIVDAYTHGDPKHGGSWVIECEGAYPWQEPRFSPEQWQAFYEVQLADHYKAGTLDAHWWREVCRSVAVIYPNGQLASTVNHIVALSRRARGEVA